jgi:predicted metal-dependent hydrolase
MVQPDKIIRSSRKTLSISVDTFGRLIVRAPKQYSEERIFAFIKEKESWILRKQAERKGAGADLPPENLHGYTFSLLGKPTKIVLCDGKKVGYDAEQNIIYLPMEKSKERLVKWLKDNAKRILTTVTERKAAEMGVSYKSIAITSAKTRWGSCAGNNALRFSFRLLYCPKEVIDYVVVHELAHTVQHNHSKKFWQVVERYIPDWKARRKWLKSHGIFMEIF